MYDRLLESSECVLSDCQLCFCIELFVEILQGNFQKKTGGVYDYGGFMNLQIMVVTPILLLLFPGGRGGRAGGRAGVHVWENTTAAPHR